MGNCCGVADETTNHIEQKMKDDNEREKQKQKLLLLGAGSAGKSTIFKQLNWLWANDPNMPKSLDPMSQVKNIRENIVEAMARILIKSQHLYTENPIKYKKCNPVQELEKLSKENSTLFEYVKKIISIKEEFSDLTTEQVLALNLGPYIEPIWNLKFVRETFKWRRHYHIADNIEYFFKNAETIFERNYMPSRDDILKARIRTSGLVSALLEVPEEKNSKSIGKFEIWDAGGQRNERSKWIHQFQGVTGLIFVAALNHYCQVLFEDEKVNAMHESIQLFDGTVNLEYFIDTEIILFLNKEDLFRLRLREGLNLDIAFTNNPDWKDPDFQWNPQCNYKPKKPLNNNNNNNNIDSNEINILNGNNNSDTKEDEEFMVAYNKSLKFIEDLYTSRCKKKAKTESETVLFVHVTNACDDNNIKKVFWDVQNIIIRANLKRFGLMNT